MKHQIGQEASAWTLRCFLVMAAAFALAGSLTGARASETVKPEKLFEENGTIKVALTAPWSQLLRNESARTAYAAELRYEDASGSPQRLDVTVERRGIMRQIACQFPPVRLRFDKAQVKGTAFRGQTSLKLVTHCQKSQRFDQYFVLEMLAYRMYNLLTDLSFRVRPFQVTYIESGNGSTLYTRFAFVIEDDSDMAKRNDLRKLVVPRIGFNRLEPGQTSLMTLFQYMIGNVDWAALRGPDPAECCHNIKLAAAEPYEKGDVAWPIPYDFDSSGLVDAPYAAPHEDLPIKSVTDRLFRGYCLHNPQLENARQKILANEAAIRALVDDEELLTPSTKKKTMRYLDSFFKTAANPSRFEVQVIQKCRR